MNVTESEEWLYHFQRFGIKPGLERIQYLMEKLGYPNRDYTVIHVGGTNGKGSVCRYLQSVLIENGYRTGVYTSPHLHRLSERIVVNNKEIDAGELEGLVQHLRPIVIGMIDDNNPPTFFEILTALAFQYFKDREVDIAVVEVGLGGRYDATNIVEPLVTIVTNVSAEHENILGDDITKIAWEKAGIIKNNVPVVTAAEGDALDIIRGEAAGKSAPFTVVQKKSWERIHHDITGQEFSMTGRLKEYRITTSLLGEYQGENIAVALAGIEHLQMRGLYITDYSIGEGVKKAVNPGRMEIIRNNPMVLLDGAHNQAGMKELCKALQNDFEYNKLIFVLGIMVDKNIRSMLLPVVPLADIVITTRSRNQRSCPPFSLKKMIQRLGYTKQLAVRENLGEAITTAETCTKKGDLICVTGSLYTVGEVREYYLNKAT